MSDKLPQQPQNEEIDLGQLFNAIGRLFEKLFLFLVSVFKKLFSIIIYALKPIVNNFKLIAILLMLAAVVGFIADKNKKTVYSSDMLVKPYFDSKYQLANNVDYFNALIGSDNLVELSNIFEINTTDAKELISFKMEIGPETQNDLLIEYDAYISEIDSTLADDVSFEDYVVNRDILAGTIFSITAKSYKGDVFKSLENGFINTFENEYSMKLKKVRDSSLLIKKATHLKELEKIDGLQKTYLGILKTESENSSGSISSQSLIPLIQEKTKTREYDLFQEELKIRDKLRLLDNELLEESEFYDILSGFEDVGTPDSKFMDKYSIIFPALVLSLMILSFVLFNVFNYIKNY
jgi:hypothetical protein